MSADVSTRQLLPALRALDSLLDECKLHFDEDALRVDTVVPSKVAQVAVEIDAEYQTHIEETVVGIDPSEFYRACRSRAVDREVTVQLTDDDEDMVVSSGNTLSYVPVTDPDKIRSGNEPSEFELTTTARLPTIEFKSAVGAVSGGPNHGLEISLGDDGLTVLSIDHAAVGRERRTEATVQGPAASAQYSQSFLTDMANALPPSGEVTVELSDGFPVAITADCGVEFLLAPHVEDDPK